MSTTVLAAVLAIVGVLGGWLAPLAVGGRRPYGLGADLVVAVVLMVALGMAEYTWVMPLFNFPKWLDLTAAIGDPVVLALIALWVMRRMKPETPALE